MALTNLCLFGGAFFTPVIVGVITEQIGWWWTFWLIAIFTGAILPVVFVFCPETTYNRDHKALNIPSYSSEMSDFRPETGSAASLDTRKFSEQIRVASKRDSEIKRIEQVEQVSLDLSNSPSTSHIEAQAIEPIPWVTKKSLRLFSGRKTNESFFQLLLRPLPLFFHPGILWACLIQGTLIGWTALLGVILALVMIAPPLSFNATQTGFM